MSQRWTLITGASSGIGREMARLFAADGDALVLVARRGERLDELRTEIEAAHHVPVRVVALDLEQPDARAALVADLDRVGIAVHTLVNNAGFGLRGAFVTLPLERQMAMIELNVAALTDLTRRLLPDMLLRGSGGILNVASVASFQAGPFMAVYYATKAYVLSLSEALHEECKASGVVVSALCPGPVATEFAAIAGLQDTRLFTNGAADAAEVARLGHAAYRAGKAVAVPSRLFRTSIFLQRFVPRSVTRAVAGKVQRRRGS